MGININISELFGLLEQLPSEQNIMLVGKHGIGKSEILSNYFSDKGLKVVPLFLGQMSDPGDLIGLPRRNEQTGKTEFMPPYWFPTDDQPVVLFLDELNRARPEVLQTIMDLALNRRLAGRSLPAGSRLISAVNDGEEYQLTDLDPALVSRFDIYNFMPSAEEWLIWAAKNNLDKRVVDFISANNAWLDGNDGVKVQMDAGLEKSPDRRGWRKVSDAIRPVRELTDLHVKVLAGIVGIPAATAFSTYVRNNSLLSAQDVLSDFKKHSKRIATYQVHQLSLVSESIFRFLETRKDFDEKKVATNLFSYVSFLATSNKEAMGHFTSLVEDDTYSNAVIFLGTKAPKVYKLMTSYVQSL